MDYYQGHSSATTYILWLDRQERRRTMPECFRSSFGEKVTVIKLLIGITPQGVVSYISQAWGGRVSDKGCAFRDSVNLSANSYFIKYYLVFTMSEVIEKMMKKLDEKLEEFRKELREGQDKEAATAARRARQEPRFVFKKKSHEKSKINEIVDDAMREAEVELPSGGSSASTPSASNIKTALESLKKGREVIAERQKLIKIADWSELGWAVVNKCTADELADKLDDEKRMEKEEKAAERKATRKRKAPAEKSKASKRSASAMVPVQTFQPHLSAQFQLPFVRCAPA